MITPAYHSAEHILTWVMGELFSGIITDSRFKGDKERCDYRLSCGMEPEQIVALAEARVNEIIALSLDVTYLKISRAEAAEKYPLHRLPEDAKVVRLVMIGDEIITPCSGMHVANTSEIGKLEIRTSHFPEPDTLRLTFVVR
ncbi:MAG: hypothetical protein NTW49_04420 [Bacteroidia bacterium]|nr:hypothetical protein [Bacteroidia bacterium]